MTELLIILATSLGVATIILLVAGMFLRKHPKGEGYGPEAEIDKRYITRIESNYIEEMEQ